MEISNTKIIILVTVIILLFTQGIWIFNDAKKREDKYCWLWGLFGILNTPGNLIIYLIVTRIILGKTQEK